MAPFVVKRALRHIGTTEEELRDIDIDKVIAQIERGSLERIYGGAARQVAAEITHHVHRGTTLDAETVKRFVRPDSAVDRARELI